MGRKEKRGGRKRREARRTNFGTKNRCFGVEAPAMPLVIGTPCFGL